MGSAPHAVVGVHDVADALGLIELAEAEGDEDTLEGAKSAVTEEVGRRTGSNAALGA